MAETVTVDEDVLTLVENLNIDRRSNKPQISSKRPFGNSDYHRDVLRRIGRKEEFSNEWGEVSNEGIKLAEEYLERTKTALKVLVQVQNLEKGTYKKVDGVWEKVA